MLGLVAKQQFQLKIFPIKSYFLFCQISWATLQAYQVPLKPLQKYLQVSLIGMQQISYQQKKCAKKCPKNFFVLAFQIVGFFVFPLFCQIEYWSMKTNSLKPPVGNYYGHLKQCYRHIAFWNVLILLNNQNYHSLKIILYSMTFSNALMWRTNIS